MTQKELVVEYLKEFGEITPAKIGGTIYKGIMFGSETSKRCRELRKAKILTSVPDGKFEKFRLKTEEEKQNENRVQTASLFETRAYYQ